MIEKLKKGSILILSGPSGCGKSSLLKELYKKVNKYYFSISTTTRLPRAGEEHGVDYFFVSKEEFEKDIKANNFLEYAKVHNNYYGTSLKPINNALEQDMLVIFDIDVQGHDLVRDVLDDITTSIFITTPSLNILEERLNLRDTDSEDIIKNRIQNAKIEINSIDKYDYFIVNDNFEVAANELINIALSSQKKARLFDKGKIIKSWLG
jgi:guanylate kinase